ncbi:hypothetical protein R5W24_004116 [Gemmata sp. JC717]|uniref:hypothetical protein n=1 Tax=Gemmata algarum TaxID=2975278 RepID=UPI0021BB71A8|nr:hypothetical protein [Gemmata algarum]MDY3554984.1 hypothetical protein [Gemmata algarum]
MTRHDNECAMSAARAVLGLVAHLLRPEEQKEFFGEVYEAVKNCLLVREEMLRRERARLGKPSDN